MRTRIFSSAILDARRAAITSSAQATSFAQSAISEAAVLGAKAAAAEFSDHFKLADSLAY